MTAAVPRVFVSATTADLGRYRDAVADAIRERGYAVDDQRVFPATYQEIDEKLRSRIAGCDAVVLLIGFRYGQAPAGQPGGARRSYTQLEYDFARALKKPYFLFVADGPEFPPPEDEPPEVQKLQLDYRDEVKSAGHDWAPFTGHYHLLWRVAQMRFPWEPPRRWQKQPNNLPPSIKQLFKGREGFLKRLRERLLSDDAAVTAVTQAQVHGLGGVGKTRVAVEYGWRFRDDYQALLFVQADSPLNLTTNLARLSGVLPVELEKPEEQPDDVRLRAVLDWLAENPGWLLILDNVDSDEARREVESRVAELAAGRGHVVLTSRISDWKAGVEALELDVLGEEDAVEFLLKRAARREQRPGEEEDARGIAQVTGGLALALEQAAAYVDKRRYSFAGYLEKWQSESAAILAWHDPRSTDYPASVAVTWQTTVDQLSTEARTLLELLSFLAPDPIPRPLLKAMSSRTCQGALPQKGSSAMPAALSRMALNLICRAVSSLYSRRRTAVPDTETALEELLGYSLAGAASGSGAVRVHRLVQQVTRDRLAEAERRARVEVALGVVNAAFTGDPQDVRAWPTLDPLAPHATAVVVFADAEGTAARVGRLMGQLATLLLAKAAYAQAEPFYRRAIEIGEATLGPHHLIVAVWGANLAYLLRATGRHAEAEPLLRRALAISERVLPPDDPNIAIGLSNLADLLGDTGRHAEAEPLIRRALAISEAALGPDHPDVAVRLNNLAALLRNIGRHAEAEPLFRRALTVCEAAYGPDHPAVATALNNLSFLLRETGRHAEAEPLIRRALAVCEAAYGPHHPAVATRLNNLAVLLRDTGRPAEAEPLSERAAEILRRFEEATGHPYTG